jgi:hypothetical protein
MHRPELFARSRRYAHLFLFFWDVGAKEPHGPTSMQSDQQRKADTKNDERNQEVTVREDRADFFEIGHQGPVFGRRLAQP